MGVFKEIEKADGSGVTTFYRLSDVHDTVETDDSEGTATVIDYNAAQNKPSVNGVTLVGNKTSEDLGLQPAGDYITNDEADAKFIDEDELEAKNYVNETRLQEAIANIDHFHREIVNALPVTGQDNVLYMVRKQGSGEDIFNEYIWVGKTASETGYEFIGTTATDLTDYYQKDEVDDLLDGKVDKVSGRGLSEQNYTLAEKTKLAGLHNYDDTELQVKVANLHNYDDTDLQLRVGDLEVKEEADSNAISTIQDALDKKMICIRLVEQGDGWTWMDINGSRLTFDRAQAYLGQENCMLFVEQLENDGKVIPAEYKSETTRIRVLFKDLDSLVHIMTLGEEDLLVEDVITTEDGSCDFEVENEAVDFGTRLDEFYGNTSQEVIAAEAGTEVVDKSISVNDVNTDKENYIILKGDTSQDSTTGKNLFGFPTNKTVTQRGITFSYNKDTQILSYSGTATHTDIYLSLVGDDFNLDANKNYKASITNAISNFTVQITRANVSANGNITPGNTSVTVTNLSTGIPNAVMLYASGLTVDTSYSGSFKLQIEEGTSVTSWEKFTNGASPNPDYPQEIRTVSENNTIIVEGKNLMPTTLYKGITYNIPVGTTRTISTYTGSYVEQLGNGKIRFNSPSTTWNEFNLVSNVLPRGNYRLHIYKEDGTTALTGGTTVYKCKKISETQYKNMGVANVGQSWTNFNTLGTTNIYIDDDDLCVIINFANNAVVNNGYVDLWCQLEKGTTVTNYEPYQGVSYPINLGTLELCKIENNQDYFYKKNNNWYIHKEVGKTIFNDCVASGTGAGGTTYMITLGNISTMPSQNWGYGYCDYFARGTDKIHNVIRFGANNRQIFIYSNDDRFQDKTSTDTWLSTHPLTVYYQLETPTDTLVTNSTLSSQLDALYNAALPSLTNIYSNTNNLPSYIDLKYNVVTPSPSPDRPSEIKVVKGNNTIWSHGKNLVDFTTIPYMEANEGTATRQGRAYTITNHSSQWGSVRFYQTNLKLEPSTVYTFSADVVAASNPEGARLYTNSLINNTGDAMWSNYTLPGNRVTLTFTTPSSISRDGILGLYPMGVNQTATFTNIQIEKGSTGTEYDIYRGQTFPLSLGQIELCKIGNYKDKIYKQDDTWYLHKETNKMVLNGSENWSEYGTGTTTWFYYVGVAGGVLPNSIYYSNLYPQADVSTTTDDGFTFNSTGGVLRVRYGAEDTVENYKNFLVSHNLAVYYPLATPTDTEITDATLLTQLENLQQITQYKHTYIELIPATDNEIPDAQFTYISNAVINASDRVLGKDTYWNDEVPTSADLPSNAEEGEIRIVQDTQNVYIYDGYEWIPFDKGGEIDLSNYLAKDNTTAWIPTGAFNPATKKYVDDSVGGVFVPTKTSQLTNDSNFIGKNSNDLTYYYTKTQTYTKSEVDALIGGGGGGGNVSITVSGDTLVITTE